MKSRDLLSSTHRRPPSPGCPSQPPLQAASGSHPAFGPLSPRGSRGPPSAPPSCVHPVLDTASPVLPQLVCPSSLAPSGDLKPPPPTFGGRLRAPLPPAGTCWPRLHPHRCLLRCVLPDTAASRQNKSLNKQGTLRRAGPSPPRRTGSSVPASGPKGGLLASSFGPL